MSAEMRPQSCKSKGRRFQQKIVKDIRDAFPQLSPDDVVSTSMGAPGEDIRLSANARTSVPLSIECKCVEKISIWQCIEQCERNTPEEATPCVVFSRNRSATYAVVPWDALLELYKLKEDNAEIPTRLRALLAQLTEFA